MKRILKFGINGNVLKTIALIAMVIDHIGFYFEPFLNVNLMFAFRYIGRIAMPIFTYLVVQGFFHTSNFKKYIARMGIWAGITQLSIYALMIVNLVWVKDYTAAGGCYKILNILFNYTIALLIMKLLHHDILIKKWDYNKNMFFKLMCIIIILIACIFLPIDYSVAVPILTILFYFIEKMKIKFLINTENIRKNMNKIIKFKEQTILHGIYILLLFIALVLVTAYLNLNICTLFAILPIALYNGERGKKSKILKKLFYFAFPIQHILLCSIGMLLTLT